MNILKRLRNSDLQPKNQFRTNHAKMSATLLAVVLIIEIITLLVVPHVYHVFLAPSTADVSSNEDQNLPLTSNQIKAAWPNLPSAQAIVDSGKGDYSMVNTRWGTIDLSQIYNHTWVSPINAEPRNYPSGVFVTRLVPVENYVWLQLNDTTWLCPGNSWLTTDNPPYVLPLPSANRADSGSFQGTGLSIEYLVTAFVAVAATVALGYLFHKRRSD